MAAADPSLSKAGDSSMFSVAPSLAKNPLGIVALALVLVYGLATVVTIGSSLDVELQRPLVWFMVVYPVLVLIVFVWLIAKHSNRLYAPADFRNDESFLAATQGQLRSVAFLSAAQVRHDGGGVDHHPNENQVSDVVETVIRRVQKVNQAQILWVDDRPENNVWERGAFISAGVEVKLALTTAQALESLSRDAFQLVISDMGRVEGPKEGYVLLDEMRRTGDVTPFVIYASSRSDEHKRETRKHGGQGCTNDPTELFDIGMALITRP